MTSRIYIVLFSKARFVLIIAIYIAVMPVYLGPRYGFGLNLAYTPDLGKKTRLCFAASVNALMHALMHNYD